MRSHVSVLVCGQLLVVLVTAYSKEIPVNRLNCSVHGDLSLDIKNNTWICACKPNYVGITCDHQCFHGNWNVDNQECLCDTGYVGLTCNNRRCVNGDWRDIEERCLCQDGYTGVICNIRDVSPDWSTNDISIVAGIVASATVLGIAMIGFLLKGCLYSRDAARRRARTARDAERASSRSTSSGSRPSDGSANGFTAPPKYEDVLQFKRYKIRQLRRIVDPLRRRSRAASRSSSNGSISTRRTSRSGRRDSIYSIDSELPTYESLMRGGKLGSMRRYQDGGDAIDQTSLTYEPLSPAGLQNRLEELRSQSRASLPRVIASSFRASSAPDNESIYEDAREYDLELDHSDLHESVNSHQ